MPDRTCDKCGQTGSDPHHVQYAADLSLSKHIDCCAEDGCAICQADSARAQADGTHLRDFVRNRPSDHWKVLFEEHGIESEDYQRKPEAVSGQSSPSRG
jgi:hypothetical protein